MVGAAKYKTTGVPTQGLLLLIVKTCLSKKKYIYIILIKGLQMARKRNIGANTSAVFWHWENNTGCKVLICIL